jgi:hypothetical protein
VRVSTQPSARRGVTFQIDFDSSTTASSCARTRRGVVVHTRGQASVASFDENLRTALRDLGIDVEIARCRSAYP